MRDFKIACGSLLGRDHKIINKNNQDSLYVDKDGDNLVCIVTDGCGDPDYPYNEIGAFLGARIAAKRVLNHFSTYEQNEINFPRWYHIKDDILFDIETICDGIGLPYKEIIPQSMLFTICGVAMTEKTAYFFTIGDGTIFINGKRICIEDYPNNAPPYIAYDLIDTKIDPDMLNFNVRAVIARDRLESFLIGSDGVQYFIDNKDYIDEKSGYGDISQFWECEEYFSNPAALTNRLVSVNRDVQTINYDTQKIVKKNGPLRDDITICTGRMMV